jgi:thiol-disulfide isomerase/thioredoxin
MRFLFLSLSVLFASEAFAQSGYKINFKIKGWKDTTAYLGYYYGEITAIKDTARVKSDGSFFFDNKNPLRQGVYFLVLNKTRIFDFMVGKNQFFTLETDKEDYITHMKVTGDEDNKLFFENMAYNMERNKEVEPFLKTLKDSTLTEDQKKSARDGYAKINDKVMEHQKQLIEKNSQTMTARLMNATRPITIPDPPKKADGTIDSTFQLRYYRQHYFDNFNLADDAMIQLPKPMYQEKVKEYLEKLFIPQPDTITKAINGLVEKAKKNPETYKYLVMTGMYLYQQPEIMGLDEVFVRLYDKYFATGEMDYWVNSKTKQNMKEHADKIRSSMIGRPGTNLIMQDDKLQPRALYDIKAKYSIVYFFRPSCGHCREETPKLVEFYNKNKTKYNLEVYAVSSDTSMKEMRDFIKEFKTPWITVNGPRSYLKQHYSQLYHADTTPTVYILDDKKIIIAKKIPVPQVDDFLSRYEKRGQIKKATQAKSTGKTP